MNPMKPLKMIDGSRARKTRAFTLIELLTVIGIIAILAAILIPVISKVRASANTVSCVSNLRQLGAAVQLYTQDYGNFPYPNAGADPERPNPIWFVHLLPFVDQEKLIQPDSIYHCVECANTHPTRVGQRTYGYNGQMGGVKPLEVMKPAETVVIGDGVLAVSAEESGGSNSYWFFELRVFDARDFVHGGKVNLLFADGHVGSLTQDEVPLNRAEEPFWNPKLF